MQELVMMCGLPGSGKSTYAKTVAKRDGLVYLGSDDLRMELFGTLTPTKDDAEVFRQMTARAKDALSQGKSVILDACFVTQKKRAKMLNQIFGAENKDKIHTKCVVMATEAELCKERCHSRFKERQGPLGQDGVDSPEAWDDIILSMQKIFQVPNKDFENWDEIVSLHDKEAVFDKEEVEGPEL